MCIAINTDEKNMSEGERESVSKHASKQAKKNS